MKKSSLVVLAAVSLVSAGSVFAATSGAICSGSATAGAGATLATPTTSDAEFVRQGFPTKCSANVHLSYSQTAINFAVGSGSVKGKTAFGGSTAGGAVAKVADCNTSTGCDAAAATAAATTALNAAGGST